MLMQAHACACVVAAQVYCCWGGVVKLRAEPFLRGLRFRGPLANASSAECASASEAGVLCGDLYRLGHGRALIDAGVIVSPQLEAARRLSTAVAHQQRMPWVRRSRWVEVLGGGDVWRLSREQLAQQAYRSVACCGEGGAGGAGGQQQCRELDVLSSNVTDAWLRVRASGGGGSAGGRAVPTG